MIPKYAVEGARVLVRFGSDWRKGIVVRRAWNHVDVEMIGDASTVHIHKSVIRRDMKRA